MAYMTQDGEGPFPNLANEFCGNFFVDSDPIRGENETQEAANRRQELFLSVYRFSRPRPTAAGAAEELEQLGLVGLYYKKDQPLGLGCIEVETPEELKEPS